jgi:hypothetical protein
MLSEDTVGRYALNSELYVCTVPTYQDQCDMLVNVLYRYHGVYGTVRDYWLGYGTVRCVFLCNK